jgi:hypothetical protein
MRIATMRIDLQRGRFLRVMDGAGSTLTAHAGSVWVTEEDSARDVVLRAGQSLRLGRRGLALVEAFDDADLSFEQFPQPQ